MCVCVCADASGSGSPPEQELSAEGTFVLSSGNQDSEEAACAGGKELRGRCQPLGSIGEGIRLPKQLSGARGIPKELGYPTIDSTVGANKVRSRTGVPAQQ